MAVTPPEPLWGPTDVAAYFGVPVKTIYVWKSEGKGPRSFRVGKHLRFRPSECEAWLETVADKETA